MNSSNIFLQRLGLRYPIIQAPMAEFLPGASRCGFRSWRAGSLGLAQIQ